MRVVITGGAGFIGSHLTRALLQQGHLVDVIDNLTTGSRSNVTPFLSDPKYKFHFGNASNPSLAEPLVREADVIFHLAASVGVRNIVENPIESLENNIFTTSQILRLADAYQKRLFTFSTSEVYGKSTQFPSSEDNDIVLGPYNKLRWSYAASKLVDDYLARAYFEEKQTAVTIVRLFNTIGQGQLGLYGMVVPRFFKQAMSQQPLTVYGTGQQTRCFSDVRDVITALLKMVDNTSTFGELINIGSQHEISVYDLAVQIKKITHSSSPIEFISFQKAYGESFEDMERRLPCQKKLQNLTGFSPHHTLQDTLQWIYEGFLLGDSNIQAPEVSLNLEAAETTWI